MNSSFNLPPSAIASDCDRIATDTDRAFDMLFSAMDERSQLRHDDEVLKRSGALPTDLERTLATWEIGGAA